MTTAANGNGHCYLNANSDCRQLRCNSARNILHIPELYLLLDNSKDVRGVVHSFSSGSKDMKAIMGYGLYVGINGIITFSREEDLLESVKQAPLERMLLETDAPYLTPKPYRGKINKPEYVRLVAEFLSNLKGVNPDIVAKITTNNVEELFGRTKDVSQ